MQLNILVLQQNLRNVEPNALLFHGGRFFDLFTAGPDAIIGEVQKTGGKDLGLSYEELKAIIELCYSVSLSSSRREISIQAQRNLSDHLLQLSEHLWQT